MRIAILKIFRIIVNVLYIYFLDIKYLEQLEQEGILEDINSEENFCINQVIEKWNYEKILLDNNIIDYNCKSNFFYFNFQLM